MFFAAINHRIASESNLSMPLKAPILAKKSLPKKPAIPEEVNHLDGITGTNNRTLNMRLITQAIESLWFPEGISKEEQVARTGAAVMLLKGIKPADEMEGMLAVQMVGTHSAAMECLRRAMIQSQTFEGRDQNLKHATKLLSIYAAQMDALNKNRGKGQQKVTVEHVHVEAGAQATIGNVQAAPNPEGRFNKAAPALTHAPGQTLDLKARTRSPAKPRNK